MKRIIPLGGLAAVLLGLVPAGHAQQFTTAAEVRPMLEATRAHWVEVREYDGKDLLYFTKLLDWRCGLKSIRYRVNNGKEKRWKGEPCHENEAVPNALKGAGSLPYVALPLGSVKKVSVRITYDDGTTDEASYRRREILTP